MADHVSTVGIVVVRGLLVGLREHTLQWLMGLFNAKCGSGCCYYTTYISVRNCGDFYVYKLNRLNVCYLRYCGNGFIPSTPGRRIHVSHLRITPLNYF